MYTAFKLKWKKSSVGMRVGFMGKDEGQIAEQITKADRLRMSRPSQKRQSPRHATAA